MTRLTQALVVLVGGCLPCSCLPGDTRPEPGSVFTTVTGSNATREGFTTTDGWTLQLDRALLCAGPMQLGDDCQKYAEYSEPGYDRILELTGAPKQKLSIMYGLGKCGIDFEIGPPSEDSVLGAGVSQADKTKLRTPGSDAYVKNDGIVLHVEGTGSDGTRTLHFDFDLRQPLFFLECSVTIDGSEQYGLDLRGGQQLNYNLTVEVEGIFRDDVPRDAALRFAPFVMADDVGNADGTVTLDELALVPLSDIQTTAPYSGGDSGVQSLADYVYRVLWPKLVVYRDSGSCTVSLEED